MKPLLLYALRTLRARQMQASNTVYILLLLLVLACSKKPAATPLIGVSVSSTDGFFLQLDVEHFEQLAVKAGYRTIVTDPNHSPYTQLEQVSTLLDQGAKILIVEPCNARTAAVLVQIAKKYDAQLISLGRLIAYADYNFHLGVDLYKTGQRQASLLLKQYPNSNIALISGPSADYNANQMRSGIMSVLTPALKRKQLTIAYDRWADQWSAEAGYEIGMELADRADALDVLLVQNDDLADGILRAFYNMGIAKKIGVIGRDGTRSAIYNMLEGRQSYTFVFPKKQLAEAAFATVNHILNGSALSLKSTDMQNGLTSVQGILLSTLPLSVAEAEIYARENNLLTPDEWSMLGLEP